MRLLITARRRSGLLWSVANAGLVRAALNTGSSIHCPLPNANGARRFILLYEVNRLGRELEALDGGKKHTATLITAQALMGQHVGGTHPRGRLLAGGVLAAFQSPSGRTRRPAA